MYAGEPGWEARILFEESVELRGVIEDAERVLALANFLLVVCGLWGDCFGGQNRVGWMVLLVCAETDDGATRDVRQVAGRLRAALRYSLWQLTARTRALVFALILLAYNTELRLRLSWRNLLLACVDLYALSLTTSGQGSQWGCLRHKAG